VMAENYAQLNEPQVEPEQQKKHWWKFW
jgi:hypothetical protein